MIGHAFDLVWLLILAAVKIRRDYVKYTHSQAHHFSNFGSTNINDSMHWNHGNEESYSLNIKEVPEKHIRGSSNRYCLYIYSLKKDRKWESPQVPLVNHSRTNLRMGK